MKKNINRKDFLKKATLTGAGLAAMPSFTISKGRRKNNGRVRIGMIGVGGRGTGHLRGLLTRSDIEIPAICDMDEEHADRAEKLVAGSGRQAPELYTRGEDDYLRMLQREDLDGIVIATPWHWHAPMAVATMKSGKHVGVEVPVATTLEGCWDLVRTSEATGMSCMILENVCYRRDVMAILNMVRQGLFGEMIHARCGYQHELREAMLGKRRQFGPDMRIDKNREWRVYNHIKRNGDTYPTHGIGPVAHWLDINRGNRFMTITSTATKARGLHNYVLEKGGRNHPDADIEFQVGDVITSTITTAMGESIIVNLNTTLPRPYSLGFHCQGTKGLWQVENSSVYLEGTSKNHGWEDFDPYQKKYDAPLWKKHEKEAAEAGHGGMDWFVRNAFVESIKRDVSPPMDVYDAAAWSAIGPLSEESIAQGGHPVQFPDFTGGKWMHNEQIFHVDGEY
ncbi:Predicted dehydrogenase [Fodinibius roseus]|uniref:Predicted dehydrogenase n=1 Tax=Fodinibius roseus TaxID=1194090 RepID=A0A1M5KZR6_9BACT|nr:Gfo/Idh/MocA family oxidoreductase [Fodinibius roseus]SHG58362.1 Predicted dehydrogenase [Fodinibius roseus]